MECDNEEIKLVVLGFLNIVREYLHIEEIISKCVTTEEWKKCAKTANLYLTDEQIRGLDTASLATLIKQEYKNMLLNCIGGFEGKLMGNDTKKEEWEW